MHDFAEINARFFHLNVRLLLRRCVYFFKFPEKCANAGERTLLPVFLEFQVEFGCGGRKGFGIWVVDSALDV